MNNRQIILKKVNVNNLKNVDLVLNRGELIVFTGVSGSGKSSLAFDTIYIEGQRRYIESLPHNTKRYIKELQKPLLQEAKGLSPTIAIEQKTVSKNPRSTVGTLTFIYDFLRVLFSKVGVPHCPISGEVVSPTPRDEILKRLEKLKKGSKVIFLAPFVKNKKGKFKEEIKDLIKKGFTKIKVDDLILSLDETKALDGSKYHNIDIVIDRIIIEDDFSRIKEATYQALDVGNGFFSVFDTENEQETSFSEYAYAKKSKKSYPPLTPSDFSFNHPSGMCDTCSGLGEIFEFDIDKIIDPKLSIQEDCCYIAGHYETVKYGNIYRNLAKIYDFDLSQPWEKLPKRAKDVFLYGTEEKWTSMQFTHPITKKRWYEYVQYRGAIYEGHKKLIDAKSDIYKKRLQSMMTHMICPDCKGNRIKAYPAACEFKKRKIFEIADLTIEEATQFFQSIKLNKEETIIGKDLIEQILKRLRFLQDVGLGYLSLNRMAPTLSGGEGQRVRLAAQIGSGLIGTTYVLDEPSIGLHPQDHSKLIKTLTSLRDKGNTVIVVEHDKETILAADTIVDVGPLAGQFGGEIIAQGKIEDIIKKSASLTGKYLSGEYKISSKKKTNSSISKDKKKNYISVKKIFHNNLKNVNVTIPLNNLVCVTGVSGSGKSSLISQTLYPALKNALSRKNENKIPCGKFGSLEGIENIDRIIYVDQSPIGKITRSNPATYIKVLDEIRKLFSSLPESKIRGYTPGHFSFNVKEGSCKYCKGLGEVKLDMDFMEDVYSTCNQCQGKRYSEEILSIEYKGYNINDILNLEVSTALEVFENIPSIYKKLKLLKDVGLDYLHLGQSSKSLSGGEAQRIKLSKELSKKQIGHTVYILDEPTTGLHFHDIKKLLEILYNLIDKNSTVIVIEHNMDFVNASTYVIDLGPGAGKNGGNIIAQGTLNEIKKKNTPTTKALNEKLLINTKKQRKTKSTPSQSYIKVENAHLNNLKNIDLEIPLGKTTVFTGPSGSGKTTLAFDTIYAEAQKRYIEAMPLFSRLHIKKMGKSDVDNIDNLAPCIALEQKSHGANPRSTVGTITEIYDHLRLLYTHMGTAYCPETNLEIKTISKSFVKKSILNNLKDEKIQILSPIKLFTNETFEEFKERLNRQGFLRIRLNGEYFELDEKNIPYNASVENDLFLVIDRLKATKDFEKRLIEAIDVASKISNGEIFIATKNKDTYYNLAFAVEKTGKSYPPITLQSFSFNSAKGMCLECQGIGYIYGINLAEENDILSYSIYEILNLVYYHYFKKKVKDLFRKYFNAIGTGTSGIDIDTPIEELPQKFQDLFFHGDTIEREIEKDVYFRWRGLNNILSIYAKHGPKHIHEALTPFMEERVCPKCRGSRLNPLSRNVKVNDLSIVKLCSLEIKDAFLFIKDLQPEQKFLLDIIEQIKSNLTFLMDIGLGYLSLDRSAPSLSGGEMQRIYLSKNLGSGLTSCIYVLDEPTIGLHPYNTDLLINALKKLKDLNNTLLLVEHDEEIIKNADFICDFGPGAGTNGGSIIASGSYSQILKNNLSLTGQYLSGQKKVPLIKKKTKHEDFIKVEKAYLHNLKNISVEIPKEAITTISGVSGCGKSTLADHILKVGIEKAIKTKSDFFDLGFGKVSNITFEKIVFLDQKLLKSSPRSDVSTYSEIMPIIREFYSLLPQAASKGFKPRYFSFNHPRGMCKTCYGFGYKKVDLQYLPDVKLNCPSCSGYRINSRSLEIKYKNKHIGHIGEMTVAEAKEFFSAFPKILKKLNTLIDVGLGYLKLGQGISTLSGGEGQRLKLSKELSKRSSKKTIYILDEPTIGLHSIDIEKLIKIFEKLRDKKSTLVIIEHNLDIIQNSDYIIDLGPYSGNYGGEIIVHGTVEDLLKNKKSHTAKYLRKKISSLK